MPRGSNKGTSSKKGGKKAQSSDAVQMLKEDHHKVEELFQQCLNGPESERADTIRQIIHELEVHSTLEEEIFYPALQRTGEEAEEPSEEAEPLENGGTSAGISEELAGEDELDSEDDDEEEDVERLTVDVIESAFEDHREMKEQAERLKRMMSAGEDIRNAVVELQDMVTDHVSEEEEVLFPWAQQNLDTKELGRQMRDRKQELLASVG